MLYNLVKLNSNYIYPKLKFFIISLNNIHYIILFINEYYFR